MWWLWLPAALVAAAFLVGLGYVVAGAAAARRVEELERENASLRARLGGDLPWET